MEYADDPDFITEIYDKKEYIKAIYKATLRIQNLLKNDDNTEKTHIAGHKSKKEQWRNILERRSLLGDFDEKEDQTFVCSIIQTMVP